MAQPESSLHPILRGTPRWPTHDGPGNAVGNYGAKGGGEVFAGHVTGPKALNRSTPMRTPKKLRKQQASARARRIRRLRAAARSTLLAIPPADVLDLAERAGVDLARVIDLEGPRGWSHNWVPGSPEALAEKLHWNDQKGGEARAAAALRGKGGLSGPERKIVSAVAKHPGHFEQGHKEGAQEANDAIIRAKGLDPEAVRAAGAAMDARAKERMAKQEERRAELDKAKKEGGDVEAIRARHAHEMLHPNDAQQQVAQEKQAAAWNRKQAEKLARRNERAQAAALGVRGPIRHGGKPPAAERAPQGRGERRAQAHEAQAAKHIDRAEKARKAGRPQEAVKHEQAAARSTGRAHGIRAFVRYLAAAVKAGHRSRQEHGMFGGSAAAGRAQYARYAAGEFNREAVKGRKAVKKAASKQRRQAARAAAPSRKQLVKGAAKGIGSHAAGEARSAGRGVRAASSSTGQNLRRAARAIRAEHQTNQRLRQQARQPLFIGAKGKPTSAPKQAWPAPNWNLAESGGDVTDLAVQVASTTDGPTTTRKTGMGDLVNHVRSSKTHGMRIPRGTSAVGLGKLHRALHRKGANHSHKQGALVGGTKQVAGKNTEGTKAPATKARKNQGKGAIRLGGTYEVWGRALDLAASNVGVASTPGGHPGGGGPVTNPGTHVPMTTGAAMLNHLGKAHGIQLTAAALNGADAGAPFRLHRQAHLLTLFPGGHHEHPGADLAGTDTIKIDLAVLKAAQRRKVPASKFGLPKEGKYPMPDQGHAANAKARATQALKKGRITPAQHAKITAKANRILGSSKAA